jgi:hypothetical protein
MRIKDVYDKDLHLSFGEVALDRQLGSNIQLRLKKLWLFNRWNFTD